MSRCFWFVRYWAICILPLPATQVVTWPKCQDENWISWEWKELFKMKEKAFFIIFKAFIEASKTIIWGQVMVRLEILQWKICSKNAVALSDLNSCKTVNYLTRSNIWTGWDIILATQPALTCRKSAIKGITIWLTSNRFHTLFCYFHCWLWTIKCR